MADKLTIDCTSGERRTEPLTAEEQAERDAMAVEAADREVAEEQARVDAEAARTAWRDAIAGATSIAALRDAILGTNLPAQAETRVK